MEVSTNLLFMGNIIIKSLEMFKKSGIRMSMPKHFITEKKIEFYRNF
jgi:hypothetical protein